ASPKVPFAQPSGSRERAAAGIFRKLCRSYNRYKRRNDFSQCTNTVVRTHFAALASQCIVLEGFMRVRRLLSEFGDLRGILAPRDFAHVVLSALTQAPQIVRTGRLRSLDAAMSRDVQVRYRGGEFHLPLPKIDQMLGSDDNPTFGNVRELYARDCYFRPFRFSCPVGFFLDLGANRGMVSIMALSCLGADRAIGVEPQQKYEPVLQLLLQANNLSPDRAPRYARFITSPSVEARDPGHNLSIETIRREQGVDQFGLVKIDIEGG